MILVRVSGWVGGPPVIIGLISVQLQLNLPTGTELDKKLGTKRKEKGRKKEGGKTKILPIQIS